ncbi:hypothetical protein GUJ93_ZPchr0004g38636 [Zizania palustris]|uniref:Uncharacterized protein n=1 Tax=Zizania palustris TaxID=103762 RepID=A0A8J5S076_ZIZPA|nr:hypothetical protein GUJ93_ZPchr0004g38636 [Zizania palustris]
MNSSCLPTCHIGNRSVRSPRSISALAAASDRSVHAAMSTCSTATSAARRGQGHERRRRRSCEHGVRACGGGGGLETRWRELEREWDAYKTGRTSGGRCPTSNRRRSRSATGTPSSAVVTAGSVDASADLLLGLRLRGSPRQLVSSLQRTVSSGSTGSAGVTARLPRHSKNQIGRYDDSSSSGVCSVDAAPMAAVAMSTSCSCSSAVLRCGCGCGCRCGYCHSSTSSCSDGAASLFSLGEQAVAGEATKTAEARWPRGSLGRLVAIAVVGATVVAVIVTASLEFAMDDGRAEFLMIFPNSGWNQFVFAFAIPELNCPNIICNTFMFEVALTATRAAGVAAGAALDHGRDVGAEDLHPDGDAVAVDQLEQAAVAEPSAVGSSARRSRRGVDGGVAGGLPTYRAAPQLEVRLEEFELFAVDRLRGDRR